MAGGNIHNYRAFLFQLNQNFTTNHVDEMKFILKNRLQASDLESIDKAFKLFDLLEKRGILSENNLSILKELFETMGREDQCRLVDDFIRHGALSGVKLPTLETSNPGVKLPTLETSNKDIGNPSSPSTTFPLLGPIEQNNFKPVETTSVPVRHDELPSGGIMFCPKGIPSPDVTVTGTPDKIDVLSTFRNLPLNGSPGSFGTACKVLPNNDPKNSPKETINESILFQLNQTSSQSLAQKNSDEALPIQAPLETQVAGNTSALPLSVLQLNSPVQNVIPMPSRPQTNKLRPITKTDTARCPMDQEGNILRKGANPETDTIQSDGPQEVSDVATITESVKVMQLQTDQESHAPGHMDLNLMEVTQQPVKEKQEENCKITALTAVCESNSKQMEEKAEFQDDLGEFFNFSICPNKPDLHMDLYQSFHLRPYQEELSRSAISGDNCIICAPTGSGKTITAAYICKQIREKHIAAQKEFKALFIVCIRNLVTQQRDAFNKVFVGEDDHVVDALDPNLPIKVMMDRCDIIMLTAQTFVNELGETDIAKVKNPNHSGLEIGDFDMLIFDECHHTNLKHPYNQCMRKYQRDKRTKRGKLPQIIGMTASLGVGEKENPVEHYIKICANLDCKTIQHVTSPENEKSLLEECPVPSVKQIIAVKPRMSKDGFAVELHKIMEQIELTFAPSDRGVADRGTQLYEAWAVNNRIQAERDGDRVSRIKYEALNHFNNALMIYEDLLAKNGLAHLREKFFVDEPHKRPEEPLNEEQYIYDIVDDRMEKLRELAEESDKNLNPKLQALVILLLTLNQKGGNINLAKGILLTRTRFSTQALVDFIREREDLKNLIFPDRLVGQGGEDLTMSDKKQQQVIKRFRGGTDHYQGKNLLVATDVAQEGLDIPTCNYVIRYNFVSNEIGSVQSRGRARAKNSESYLIVTKGSINERRELMNLRREHLMMEALKKIHKLDQKELEKQILSTQNKLWEGYMSELKREQARKSEIKTQEIEIFCKKCTRLLCRASDMLQKGSQYICKSEEFEEKIEKRSGRKEEFRLDQIVGNIRCADASCQQTLGPWFKYKNGLRNEGYVLSAKNITFKIKGTNVSVKQWSKLPCEIPVEALY